MRKANHLKLVGQAKQQVIGFKGLKPPIFKITPSNPSKNSLFEGNSSDVYKFHLVEYCEYELVCPENYVLKLDKEDKEKLYPFIEDGILKTQGGMGMFRVPIYNKNSQEVGYLPFNIISYKIDEKGFEKMLEDMCDRYLDIISDLNSPVSWRLDQESVTEKTLSQQYSFIKSVIEDERFDTAVDLIKTQPVTKWTEIMEIDDIRKLKKLSHRDIRSLTKGLNRVKLRDNHYLKKEKNIDSLPRKINLTRKLDSVDTQENRFIKYVLEEFRNHCERIKDKAVKEKEEKIEKGAQYLIDTLERHISHPTFKNVSNLKRIEINSPILQRKVGYRYVFAKWLVYPLVARIRGIENFFDSGLKPIHTLYEYWILFEILKLFKENPKFKGKERAVHWNGNSLNVKIRESGEYSDNQEIDRVKPGPVWSGKYTDNGHELQFDLFYNIHFSKEKLRPDYTIAFYLDHIDEYRLIHFDAKYRVESFWNHVREKGKYEGFRPNKCDLKKMKDEYSQINNTSGAFVLYPGSSSYGGNDEMLYPESLLTEHRVGALPIRPNNDHITKKFENSILQIFKLYLLINQELESKWSF
ncbi:MAG: DUF2357 domain-containing protein [Flavobacteriaceae bacterium]|nr:DUF2357 domain-containing protein [Flavobacteriaceae bacterium]